MQNIGANELFDVESPTKQLLNLVLLLARHHQTVQAALLSSSSHLFSAAPEV